MSQKLNTGNTPTPYDDVHRTLLNNCKHLVIPMVNEVFHKHYGLSEKVTLFQNEFFYTADDGKQKRRSTDSHFAIGDIRYHLECQSTADGTIMFRIFEYDSQMALQDSEWDNQELTVNFPNTALIFLRHTKNTPNFMRMRINVPKDSCYYEVPILKVQNYSLDEIFEKQLYFLLPFHLFTYEHKFSNVKEGLGDIMFGKILDYEAHDILLQGENRKLISQIQKKLEKGLPLQQIADEVEESLDTVQKLIQEHKLL